MLGLSHYFHYWWFQTWLLFSIINIWDNPSDELIFFRGVYHQPEWNTDFLNVFSLSKSKIALKVSLPPILRKKVVMGENLSKPWYDLNIWSKFDVHPNCRSWSRPHIPISHDWRHIKNHCCVLESCKIFSRTLEYVLIIQCLYQYRSI